MDKIIVNESPEWVTRGKTIRELMLELSSFEDQGLFVEISIDSGKTSLPISLVVEKQKKCLLINCQLE